MKNIIKLFILLLILSSNLYSQNKLDDKGRKQGYWSKEYSNGNKIYEGSFKDDYQEGMFTYYYEDGTIKAKTNFSNKGSIAETQTFYPNSKLMSKGKYIDKKKHGVWELYDEEGRKIKNEEYNKGVKQGTWKVWDKNDILVESIQYDKDLRNGVCYKNFYNKGFHYFTYKDDKKHGLYEDYYYFEKLRIKGEYALDKREGNWSYFDSLGNIAKKQVWRNDKLIEETLRIDYGNKKEYIKSSDIAYIYPKGKKLYIALKNSKGFDAINDFEEFLSLLSIDEFILLNKQYKIYSRLESIKSIEPAPKDQYYIILEPKSPTPIISDKESKMAMESLFLNK